MPAVATFASKHPVLFALGLIIAWLLVAMVVTGIASTALGRPYADALTIGRLSVTLCCLLLVWRLGWLRLARITSVGHWSVWLIALGSVLYVAGGSLFSFYGAVDFDWSSLIRLSEARSVVFGHFVIGASEEILFRGIVLCALVRAWDSTPWGKARSVALTALLFALLHLMQVATDDLSLSAALLLCAETMVISFWWGVVVVWGRSVWPAVAMHVVGNAVVAVQGVTHAMITPGILAYERLFWFSVPLGVLGIGLLFTILRRPGRLDERTAH